MFRQVGAGFLALAFVAGAPAASFAQNKVRSQEAAPPQASGGGQRAGDLVGAEQPQALAEIATRFGSASIETDSYGDPMVDGQIAGQRYRILFYGCTDGSRCQTVSFVTWYRGSFSMDAVNQWNAENRFGKVYIDSDGDLALEMDVNLARGVSSGNFEETVDWWRATMEEVKRDLVR